MRLNIPAGTAVRFEPGDEKKVTLVALGGASHVYGLNGLTNGPADASGDETRRTKAALRSRQVAGIRGELDQMTLEIPRRQYAGLYGPTTGDRVRLADTDLLIEIERDLTTPATKPNSAAAKCCATAWANPLQPLLKRARSMW